MALDSLVKRFFPFVVGVLLAAVAYFQASGVVQLLAAKFLDVDGQSLVAASVRAKPPLPAQSVERASAQPIIDNNLFDWEVDLDPPPPPPPDAGAEEVAKPELDLSNPLEAPRCDDVSVRIVTESPDPIWSVAVLQGPGEDKPSSRRVGDVLGGYEVSYIGFNHTQASPAVWLTKDVKLCQALLFAPALPEKPAPAATSAASPPEPPAKKGAGSLPSEIADKITKVSENEFNVERAVVDHILENQGEFMKSARVVPEKTADGKIAGIRLFGVRPDTLLGTLGMKNGDRLETINGFNMGNPEEALNAYARLRTANKLSIKVTRRGQPTTIDFNIK
jgi:general secretion pathway protein C